MIDGADVKIDKADRFPLSTKAILEQEGIARFLMSSLPPAYYEAMDCLRNFIDDNVMATDEVKDAVMGGVVFMNASPFTFDDLHRFKTEYNDVFDRLVTLLLTDTDTGKDVQTIASASQLVMLKWATSGEAVEPQDDWAESIDIEVLNAAIERTAGDARFEKIVEGAKAVLEKALARLSVPNGDNVRDGLHTTIGIGEPPVK
jgi:hypothetical protein